MNQSPSAVAQVRLPWLLQSLLDDVFNCPPLPCAAAEDQVNASHAPVLHLQAPPRALVQDGSVLQAGEMGKDGKMKILIACEADQDQEGSPGRGIQLGGNPIQTIK